MWKILAVAYLALLWAASLWPAGGVAALRMLPDYVEHAVAYALGAVLLARAFRDVPLVVLWLGLFVMGAGIEGAQGLTETRSPSLRDIGANGIGAFVGVGFVKLWRRSRPSPPGGEAPGEEAPHRPRARTGTHGPGQRSARGWRDR